MDYISQLNLEELPSGSPENTDLSSFTDNTFFDFEQFSSDASLKLAPTELPDSLNQFLHTPSFVKQEEPVQSIPVQLGFEDDHDQYSEHDKKKRNTLASARFRIKKKQREQEMERTVKMLTERVSKYSERINQLELENACLKSLILEKNEKKSNDLLLSIKQKSLS